MGSGPDLLVGSARVARVLAAQVLPAVGGLGVGEAKACSSPIGGGAVRSPRFGLTPHLGLGGRSEVALGIAGEEGDRGEVVQGYRTAHRIHQIGERQGT